MIDRWVKRTTWVESVEVEVVAETVVAAVAEAEGKAVQDGSQGLHPLKGSQVGVNQGATVVEGQDTSPGSVQ